MTKVSRDIDWKKTETDLAFIKAIQKFAAAQDWRMVLSGGYGLDFVLGRITRTHRDVDIILYGTGSRDDAEKIMFGFLSKQLASFSHLIKDDTYYRDISINAPGLGATIYYVQTLTDPFQDIHSVIRADGAVQINDTKDFPPPVKGELRRVVVEAEDQSYHLQDILRKGGKRNIKYRNDIANITALLSRA